MKPYFPMLVAVMFLTAAAWLADAFNAFDFAGRGYILSNSFILSVVLITLGVAAVLFAMMEDAP